MAVPKPQTCQICTKATQSSNEAQLISPVSAANNDSQSTCYIEYQNSIYQIFWNSESLQAQCHHPDLTRFPLFDHACTVQQLTLSPPLAALIASSTLIDYGMDAMIRCSHNGSFPIVKICHSNDQCRRRIQYEFEMLKAMQDHSLRVPRFDAEQPLRDDDGSVFGYRMERLFPLDFDKLGAVAGDVAAIVREVHRAGFSHGDVHGSNVMRNEKGELVLIDLSFAGRLGERVPEHIPDWQYEGDMFCTSADEKYLARFFKGAGVD